MRRLFILGGVVLVAALAIPAALIVATAPSAPAASDEEQIRAVLSGMEESYNRSDYDGFAAHLCAAMREAGGDYEAGWHERREVDGLVRITVHSVDVTGDGAVTRVEFASENHEEPETLEMDFLREDAEWKACQ